MPQQISLIWKLHHMSGLFANYLQENEFKITFLKRIMCLQTIIEEILVNWYEKKFYSFSVIIEIGNLSK